MRRALTSLLHKLAHIAAEYDLHCCPIEVAIMDESDESGVCAALDKIRLLESRLRHAIQNSHPLSTSFGSDPVVADRERDALLSVGCANASFTSCTMSNKLPACFEQQRSQVWLIRLYTSVASVVLIGWRHIGWPS